MRIESTVLWIALVFALGCGQERIDGRYAADDEVPLTLTIAEASDGAISGTLVGPSGSAPLVGRRQGDSVAGTAGTGEEATAFTAKLEPDERLTLSFGTAEAGQTIRLHRVGDADGPDAPAAPAPPAATP
jgi:hypothetical protein